MRLLASLLLVLTATFLAAGTLSAQVPTASFVVEKSIEYHDPQGLWDRARFRLSLKETRPDGSERQTRLLFHQPLDAFEIQTDRDEAKRDGEYIVLEGETEASGLKIPTKRAWYVNADGRHLGDDILVEIEIEP